MVLISNLRIWIVIAEQFRFRNEVSDFKLHSIARSILRKFSIKSDWESVNSDSEWCECSIRFDCIWLWEIDSEDSEYEHSARYKANVSFRTRNDSNLCYSANPVPSSLELRTCFSCECVLVANLIPSEHRIPNACKLRTFGAINKEINENDDFGLRICLSILIQ